MKMENPGVDTNVGRLTPEQIIDELTYSSYRAQRDIWGASAEVCARLFPARAAEFEARFQREANEYATAKVFCAGCGARGYAFFCPSCEGSR